MTALVATPKATDANSYVTVARALEILGEQLYSTAFTGATNPNQIASLQQATRLLDQYMIWSGTKRTVEQALRWPRTGVTDQDGFFYDYDTIPDPLERATANYALAMLQRDRFTTPELVGQGFSAAKVGELDVTVNPDQQPLSGIPPNVLVLLETLGTPTPSVTGGYGVVRLRRA